MHFQTFWHFKRQTGARAQAAIRQKKYIYSAVGAAPNARGTRERDKRGWGETLRVLIPGSPTGFRV